ncbi:MAG: proteobacterial dedicated sortase system histidine kinase [Gammaproteobacteria bacterium]
MKKPFSFSIRKKLLLLSIAVLSLPYVGYQYVREMEHYLREGLETSLTGTASNISGLLSGRDTLFPQVGYGTEKSIPLFVHPMKQIVQLDGYAEEWSAWLDWADNKSSTEGSLTTKVIIAEQAGYLYVLLQAEDNQLIYQRPESPFANESDQIELFIEDSDGELKHYWIAPSAQGEISTYEQGMIWNADIWEEQPIPRSVTNISGVWQETPTGYRLELKIPSRIVDQKLGITITDVDDPSLRKITGKIKTSGRQKANLLVRASDDIGSAIDKLDVAEGRRIWVLDTAGHVLATKGNLKNQTPSRTLNRFYSWIFPSASSRFKDELKGASRLRGKDVTAALKGDTGIRWRSSPDGKAVIVTAAKPIHSDSEIIGVVVAEETTGNIQTVQRKAMSDLFTRSLIVFVVVTLLLLAFASNLLSRIRRLSREADQAIDEQGRVTRTLVGKPWNDELGDLSQHYSDMLERLKQYNDYLESLAGKLSHELRTPMAVVQSSLESLDTADSADDAGVYVDRAKDGVKRLQTLVTRLSEAARLEGALQSSEKESYKIQKLLKGCVEGYGVAYPDQEFRCEIEEIDAEILCAPDLIVQMLDKLVSNAIDFAKKETPIILRVNEKNGNVLIKIVNFGSQIPDQIEQNLFDSMISARDNKVQGEPHLGLGLYVAKLIATFHQGDLLADNLDSGEGVVFTVKLPIYG